MKHYEKIGVFAFALLFMQPLFAQSDKPVYHPCFLMNQVEQQLDFIRLNASRIFIDSFDCKQLLFDSIAEQYVRTKDKKYVDALTYIHNSGAKEQVANLYTDVIRRWVSTDFAGFLQLLYSGRGRYAALEKELISTMNMIIDGRPYKQKFMGLLHVEISKAKDKKDLTQAAYLEKLSTRIEEEKY